MHSIDADEKKRLDAVHARYWGQRNFDPSEIFTSARVVETLTTEKAIQHYHLDLDELLGLLPFTSVVYGGMCPTCVNPKNFEKIKLLIKSGLFIPMLSAPYASYPSEVTEFLLAHDHVSMLQFQLFRHHSVYRFGVTKDIHDEMHRLKESTLAAAQERRNRDAYLAPLNRIHARLNPLIDADYGLYELIYRATKDRRLGQLQRLDRLAAELREYRVAQIFNGSRAITNREIDGMPERVSEESDLALRASLEVKNMAARGLGIAIPVDLPLEKYIELVKDYQPRIQLAIDAAFSESAHASWAEIMRATSSLNREIEQIKGTRRYAILEACVGVYRNNPMLVGGALLLAAMALTGNVVGCASAGAIGAATKIAKQKGLLRDNAALNRLGRMVARDIQPYTTMLLKSYLRGSVPAINVMSLQRKIRNLEK